MHYQLKLAFLKKQLSTETIEAIFQKTKLLINNLLLRSYYKNNFKQLKGKMKQLFEVQKQKVYLASTPEIV